MRRYATISVAAWIFLAGVLVQATPTVNDYGPFAVSFYNNGDTNSDYTGEQDWTVQQMADVGASIQAWNQYINNTAGRKIQMHIFWNEFDLQGGGDEDVLLQAHSPTNGDGTTAWTYPEHIWRDGVNYDAPWDGWDVSITLDITAGGAVGEWNFGSTNPTANQIDFRSVVAREIGHAIGFFSTYDYGDDDWGYTWGTVSDPYDPFDYEGLTEWDKNLRDQSENSPENGTEGTPGDFDEIGTVYFTGANAVSLYGDDVPVYSPDPYAYGSSLVSLDEGVMTPEPLMSPGIADGELIRGPTPLELAVMTDMGWDIIPEPATVLLLILGALALLKRSRT